MIPRLRRYVLFILSFTVLLSLSALGSAQAQADQRCFPETNFCIAGRIREFWEHNGGLPVFGYPTGPQQDTVIEGRSFQAQTFERNRLELHPENQPPYDVLLGRLGADRLTQQGRDWFTFPKAQPQDGCRFFPAVEHNICGDILTAWHANGLDLNGDGQTTEDENLALFGLPISELQTETIQGKEYQVQWFERARFELHPENQPPYNVLLGLLGNEIRETTPARTPSPAPVVTATPTQTGTNGAATATVVEITDDNYEAEVLHSPVLVLLDFWAAWSGPSRAIAPALETIARKYAGRVKVGKINVDDYPKLTAQFSVSKLPTFIVIKQGSEQQRIAGPTSAEEISQMLDAQLGGNP